MHNVVVCHLSVGASVGRPRGCALGCSHSPAIEQDATWEVSDQLDYGI
jgi:hypothetical protein